MKKVFIILILTALLLVGCETSDNNSIASSDISESQADVSETSEAEVTNKENARKVSEYKPYSDPEFCHPTIDGVPITSLTVENIEYHIEVSEGDACIARITLNKIAGETQEFEREGYLAKFYYTKVDLIIDEIYVAFEPCSFTEKENVIGYTEDKWQLLDDGTYSVEYIYHEFPLSEENNSCIAKITRSNEDGEKIIVQPLSFPFYETGEYTDSILEVKDTTAFDSVQWSFSDEVLKRYGVTKQNADTESLITVTQTYPEERIFTLSAEDTDFVKDLWEGEWLVDITKTVCDFEFELDGNIIKYSNEAGLFNDYENERHMILTKEQKDAVNKMLGVE